MKTIGVFIALIAEAGFALGQDFLGEAQVPVVKEDGFYKIFVSPDLSTHLNAKFTNIRIYDKVNKEVPFFLQEERRDYIDRNFREYDILEKSQRDGCCTTIILHNPDQNQLSNINLIIRNADVTKEATLLGSDDKRQWFALKQHFVLDPISNKSGTSEIKIVDFPLSNYRYYSLRINDSTSAPLNILKAGYFEVHAREVNYTEIPVKVLKSDSVRVKKSYLHVRFNAAHVVDKMELSMKGSPFYLRKAMAYERRERTLKNGDREKYYHFLQDVELSSKHPVVIELNGTKVDDLLVIIENEDSPSLEVDFCKVYQRNRYLTAWLQKGDQYTIRIGRDQLDAPVYDLSFFKDSIPLASEVLRIGKVAIFAKSEIEPSFTFFTTRVFIWAAVVMVIVILGFMSVRLLKETVSKGDNRTNS